MLAGEVARGGPPLVRDNLLEVCQVLGIDPEDTDLIRITPKGVEWRDRHGKLRHRVVAD